MFRWLVWTHALMARAGRGGLGQSVVVGRQRECVQVGVD